MKLTYIISRISRVSALTWLKVTISGIACFLLLVRIFWPELKVDSVTLGLLVVGVLPWLSNLIESAKFPGGWEVKFRDLEIAGREITKTVSPLTLAQSVAPLEEPRPSYLKTASDDPNLALVGLRIDIETRLRKLAEINGISGNLPLGRMLRELRPHNAMIQEIEKALYQLIQAGNRAAHGARVDRAASSWAIDSGPEILAVLDSIIEEH